MKRCLFFSIFLFAAAAIADDFKTVDGKEYKSARVSRVEPDGIVISFSGGIVKLPFTELPPEVQKKYGYDSKAAADFQQQTYQADLARAQQLASARAKRQQELEEQAKSQPQPEAVLATPPAQRRQSKAASMGGSMLDQRPVAKSLIYGTVYRVVDDGLIIRVRETTSFGQERIPDDAYILLRGSFPGFVDDDRIQALGIPTSEVYRWSYKHSSRIFDVASINKLTEFPAKVR